MSNHLDHMSAILPTDKWRTRQKAVITQVALSDSISFSADEQADRLDF